MIALYENETPFTPRLVNLGDPADATALKALWPVRKFPVLRDDARDEVRSAAHFGRGMTAALNPPA